MTNRNLIMINSKALIIIRIYINNILIIRENNKKINKITELLKEQFEIKDLEDV